MCAIPFHLDIDLLLWMWHLIFQTLLESLFPQQTAEVIALQLTSQLKSFFTSRTLLFTIQDYYIYICGEKRGIVEKSIFFSSWTTIHLQATKQ